MKERMHHRTINHTIPWLLNACFPMKKKWTMERQWCQSKAFFFFECARPYTAFCVLFSREEKKDSPKVNTRLTTRYLLLACISAKCGVSLHLHLDRLIDEDTRGKIHLFSERVRDLQFTNVIVQIGLD